MAYKAPVSPGTESEGNWYVPVIGMGTGSIIGRGMQTLKDQWADTLRLLTGRQALPTTENLASLAGGINTGSQGVKAGVEAGADTFASAPTMYGLQPKLKDTVRMAQEQGGMIPRPDVMDRLMNSGLRDTILGFGNKP